jgi:hypothetical protein
MRSDPVLPARNYRKILLCLLIAGGFTACGLGLVVSGERKGWFFVILSLCLLLLAAADLLPERKPKPSRYRVVITEEDVACEHPKRKREAIRWDQVRSIWLATVPDPPWTPDFWLLFVGAESGGSVSSGCSIPTEAQGFHELWDEIEARFPKADYSPFLEAGVGDTVVRKFVVWERPGE